MKHFKEEHEGWKRKADNYAKYYLVAFRPEETLHCSKAELLPDYTWKALCDWISDLESDEQLICKARRAALVNHVCYHTTKTSHRKMMSAFRMRNRTIWNDREKAEGTSFYAHANARVRDLTGDQNDLSDFVTDDLQNCALTSTALRQIRDELQHCADQTHALDYLFLQTQVTSSHNSGTKILPYMDTKAPSVVTSAVRNIEKIDTTDINAKMDEFEAAEQSAEARTAGAGEDHSSPEPSTLSEIAERHLEECNFSPDQELIIMKVKDYLEAVVAARENPQIPPPKPFKILLTGGPGTGKSFVIETTCDLVKWLRTGKVKTSSWNGIAAVNIDGSPLCSLLNIRPTNRKATSVQKGHNTSHSL